MRTEIKGETIVLRKYEANYGMMLFEAAYESRGGEFTRWMPWCHENYTIEESASFSEYSVEAWERGSEYNYAIFNRQEEFVGGIGINQFNRTHKLVNLGYWIRTSRQNRGITPQATRLLARVAFEDLDLNRIEILAASENLPSQRAAEKSGATYEGVLRNRIVIDGSIHDAVMFSFIREDFAKNLFGNQKAGFNTDSHG